VLWDFCEKSDVLLTYCRIAAVGGWYRVFVSPFCNPWRRCVDVLVVGVGMKEIS
jgi:hypothetical protein